MPSDIETRFLRHVKKTKGCWKWMGATSSGGMYGKFSYNKRSIGAHRMAMNLWNGFDLDDTQSIHHTCGNTLCVNPDHLRTITTRENMAEMLERRHYTKAIARLNAEVKKLRKEVSCLRRNSKGQTTNRG
jgi:two-component SAPR family response regulator